MVIQCYNHGNRYQLLVLSRSVRTVCPQWALLQWIPWECRMVRKKKDRSLILLIFLFYLFCRDILCFMVGEQHLFLAPQLQVLSKWQWTHQLGSFFFLVSLIPYLLPLHSWPCGCVEAVGERDDKVEQYVACVSSRAIMQVEVSIFNYVLVYCWMWLTCCVVCFYRRQFIFCSQLSSTIHPHIIWKYLP